MFEADFWGSEILAQRNFLGVYERDRDFLCIVLFVSSNQQSHKRNLLLLWDSYGYAKTVGIFLGRQILILEFFWVKNMNLCRNIQQHVKKC